MVSIITPTYLRDNLLTETLDSVLNQTIPDWELVIVDDAQSADTEKIVKRYNDCRIKYFTRPENKKGAPVCRNIGIKCASGEYVMFLDSDDIMLPWSLKERLEAFQNYPDKDFLVFQTGFFNQQIGDTMVLWNRFDERDDLLRFLNGDVVWHTSGSFFKKESLIKKNLFYNEKALTSQDWLFHIDALLVGLKYEKTAIVPDVFVRRNPAEKRISDSHGDTDKIVNRIRLVHELLNDNEIKGHPDYMKSLVKTAVREFFLLLNTRRNFDPKLLQQFFPFIGGDRSLQKILAFLKLSSSVGRFSFLGYRAFNRFFFPSKLQKYLQYKNHYRAPMTETEKRAFGKVIPEIMSR